MCVGDLAGATSLEDERVHILRRGRKPKNHARLSSADVAFLLKWPFYKLAAATVPPALWPSLHRISRFAASESSRDVAEKIGRALGIDEAGAREVQRANLRLKSERLLQVARINGAGYEPRVTLDGEQALQAARAAGRGAVLWIAHLSFSSTLAKIALHKAGYKVFHLSRREHGFSQTQFGMRWLNPIRVAAENQYLAGRIVHEGANPGSSLLRARGRLGENCFVSVTEGAWEGSRIAEGRLFGGAMRIATGAPALAALAQCPLLPVFAMRTGDAFRVRIEPSVMPPKGDREERIAAATQAFFALLERTVRDYPEQWDSWKYLDFASPR